MRGYDRWKLMDPDEATEIMERRLARLYDEPDPDRLRDEAFDREGEDYCDLD